MAARVFSQNADLQTKSFPAPGKKFTHPKMNFWPTGKTNKHRKIAF
jgi:hypothetical protein